MFPRVSVDLFCTRFGYIPRVDTTYSRSLGMYCQHYLCRPFPGHSEELLKNLDHEIHRGVVIVQQEDLIHGWLLKLGLRCRNSNRTIVVLFCLMILF